jgi:demethylmenaquinone methyltransferase/2-methoxy-6-polyprenyl-1,4-benzoquinol methylase
VEAATERPRKEVGEAPWLAQGEAKREFVKGMFAEVAPSYDLINGLLCGRLHHRWRRTAVRVLGLRKGERALDVCCGTGDFVRELGTVLGLDGVLGIDFCEPMLRKAAEKLPGARLGLGDACRLPVGSGTVDAVTVGWGLRNVPDVELALREAVRVLRPGGRFVTLDMARSPLRASEFVFHRVAPFFGRVFGKTMAYTYLPKSTLTFLSREEMKAAMERAGLSGVRWRDFMLGNVCMHLGVKA